MNYNNNSLFILHKLHVHMINAYHIIKAYLLTKSYKKLKLHD